MKLPSITSAGQFFELFRPAKLLVSALLSTWVLASARRAGFRALTALAWALGTFFLPFVVLPVYLLGRLWGRPRAGGKPPLDRRTSAQTAASPAPVPGLRFMAPLVYAAALLLIVSLYLYHDYNTVDAHLARAAQAKLLGRAKETIREYRAALALEDNAHTHKLLGIELADTDQWADATTEFRAAERGGEPDESLPFRIGKALEAGAQTGAAEPEYARFLSSKACTKVLPDERCEIARRRTGLGK